MTLNGFSLFSGIGGFEKGFQKVGIPVNWVGHSEIDHFAGRIYSSHFSNPNYGDIRSIDPKKLPKIDLITGGFPCQSFSSCGLRHGLHDRRGQLIFEVVRLLRSAQPQYFLLENVKGLLTHDGGRNFRTIVEALTELRYGVEWVLINSQNQGVPQFRERVYLLGTLRKAPSGQIFPAPYSCTAALTGRPHTALRAVLTPTKKHIRTTCRRFKQPGEAMFTLTTSGIHGLTNGKWIRRLTPREYERLQGFPDDWTKYGRKQGRRVRMSDHQRYKCLGNAVTVNVVAALARQIFRKKIENVNAPKA
jgi:DNA (cytosine-5)-methyltransferase 1